MLQGYVDKTFKLNTNVKTDFSIVASGPPSYAASQVTQFAEFPGVKCWFFLKIDLKGDQNSLKISKLTASPDF